MSEILKYSGDIKKCIVMILPYIEKYVADKGTILTICAQPEICDILMIMFGGSVNVHKMDPFRSIQDTHTRDVKDFFESYYGFAQSYNFKLTKPLNYDKNKQLKYKNFVCIFPKRRETDKIHNISSSIFDSILGVIRKYCPDMEIYIIGNPLDKLSVKKEKCYDVDRFVDSLDYLKYCKLFICSESNWVQIAMLCNCRNIVVYHSPKTAADMSHNLFNCDLLQIENADDALLIEKIRNTQYA